MIIKFFFLMFFILSFCINAQNNAVFSYLNYFQTVPADRISQCNHSFINLSGQAVVGSALAVAFSIFPLSAAWADAWNQGTNTSQTALGILAVSSYLFGAATGVYWIAKYENTNLSFWGTVGYSAIGGGVGIILVSVLATQYTTIPPVGVIIVALSPIVSSMIYSSLISDWQQENQTVSFYNKILSHKDLIEQTNLFNIEVLKIKL